MDQAKFAIAISDLLAPSDKRLGYFTLGYLPTARVCVHLKVRRA